MLEMCRDTGEMVERSVEIRVEMHVEMPVEIRRDTKRFQGVSGKRLMTFARAILDSLEQFRTV